MGFSTGFQQEKKLLIRSGVNNSCFKETILTCGSLVYISYIVLSILCIFPYQ